MSWLKKEGNYIIQYQLKYLTYETQELKLVTIDLPITVIPNEPNQTFRYSKTSACDASGPFACSYHGYHFPSTGSIFAHVRIVSPVRFESKTRYDLL